MNKPLSYGLNLTKRPAAPKPGAPKRLLAFSDDGGSDDEQPSAPGSGAQAEEITEFGDSSPPRTTPSSVRPPGRGGSSSSGKGFSKSRSGAFDQQPPQKIKPKQAAPPHQLGDLSSALSARKHAADAEREDPSIYDYDAAYDSFKAADRKVAASNSGAAGSERKPQYMSNLKKMAEVRDRDRKIAEDKKMRREREAEGDEFADKEKFVTEAYKKQQEENKILEEEESRREEEEARRNEAGGMTGFYKGLLDRDERRRQEIERAAEELARGGGEGKTQPGDESGVGDETEKTDADIAKEINLKGGSVAINDEGQVVDKRQLLKGGLNLGAAKKKKDEKLKETHPHDQRGSGPDDKGGYFAGPGGRAGGSGGGKQAMRDRQSRALEAQYEQALKRSREEADEERRKVEVAAKSRKTEADISSARERYLARKKAEAEEKTRKGETRNGP